MVEALPLSNGAVKDTRFKPGKIGGPGRPKGSRDLVGELFDAMRKVEKKQGKPILMHAWEQAYDNPKLLIGLLRKLIPDLQHQTGDAKPVSIQVIYGHQAPRVQVAQPIEANGQHA